MQAVVKFDLKPLFFLRSLLTSFSTSPSFFWSIGLIMSSVSIPDCSIVLRIVLSEQAGPGLGLEFVP